MNSPPSDLLDLVAQVAAGAWVPVIISVLLERITAFQRLQSETKKWVVFALFLFLPLAAEALVQYVPLEVWDVLQPYYQAAGAGFAMWLGSQVAHAWNKEK